jgi:hypothetical protein
VTKRECLSVALGALGCDELDTLKQVGDWMMEINQELNIPKDVPGAGILEDVLYEVSDED